MILIDYNISGFFGSFWGKSSHNSVMVRDILAILTVVKRARKVWLKSQLSWSIFLFSALTLIRMAGDVCDSQNFEQKQLKRA